MCSPDPGAQVKEVVMDDVPGLKETGSAREELDEGLSAFFECQESGEDICEVLLQFFELEFAALWLDWRFCWGCLASMRRISGTFAALPACVGSRSRG